MTAFELFALLMFGHFLADYPLQGEFLAKGKNRSCPIPGIPWYQILFAHAAIHGGFVGVIIAVAGMSGHSELFHLAVWLGLAETIVHVLIDDGKCRCRFGYNVDQAFHVLCKLAWVAVAVVAADMPLCFAE